MSEQTPPRWSPAAVAGVPLAVLLLYLLVPFRAARFLSLDFESWLVNQYNVDARVDVAWVAPAGWLLALGAAPLFVLALSAFGWRRLARRTSFRDPLHGLPGRVRTAAVVAVLLPFALHLAPLSLALAVGLAVEVFWWIQWHGNTQPTMELVLTRAPPVIAGCAAVFGTLTAVWALPPATRAPSRLGSLARAGARALWLLTVAALLLSSFHGLRFFGAPGRDAFIDRCHQCHVRAEALYYVKTPAEWKRTVERMKDYEYPPLYADETDAIEQVTDEDEALVVPFLCGMRSFSDAWTFRTRCQRCHGWGTRHWESRPVDNWERIPERIARWSPYYYRADVRDQVTNHLVATRGNDSITFDLEPPLYESFVDLEETCGACHSVTREFERYRRADDATRQELVQRMGARMDPPLDDAAVEELAERWTMFISDTALMVRLFPHDQPVREEGLPW